MAKLIPQLYFLHRSFFNFKGDFAAAFDLLQTIEGLSNFIRL